MSAPLYLRCECHTPYHCVLVERDPDVPGTFQFALVSTKSGRFWHRVKWGMRHVFGLEELVQADILLGAEEATQLAAYLTATTAEAGQAA